MGWAWKQSTASSGQRLVLLAVCDHMADHEGSEGYTAWPSVGRLEAMTGLSDSTIRHHLDALVELNLLEKVERRRRRNGHMGTWLYRLVTTADPSAVDPENVPTTADPSAVDHRRPIGAHETQLLNAPESPRDDYAWDLETLEGEIPDWFAKYGPKERLPYPND